MNIETYNKDLFQFLHDSPTPFHAVENMAEQLTRKGFIQLSETEPWQLEKKKGYFVIRNQSALIGFYTGENRPWETGIRMCGAHTDSPCLKIKPCPELQSETMTRLGVEVYGGALLNTWFDRGLNLAGRIIVRCRDKDNKERLQSVLINFDTPVAVIPSLPIHLDRDANTSKNINAQVDLPPLLLTDNLSAADTLSHTLLKMAAVQLGEYDVQEIMSTDLYFSDTQPPFYTGLHQEIISAPRLDNLLSCHAACTALTAAQESIPCLAFLADHEEVGSATATGADGSFLTDVLSRLIPNTEQRLRAMAGGFMVSLDNAHALHPAHPEKYDPAHHVKLNHGPTIKINAAMRYATDAVSAAVFKQICRHADVPMQTFVMRSDMPCGSTIGPAISAATGILTIDVGAPTLAMHAIRELTGKADPHAVYKVMKGYFTMDAEPLLSLT